MIPILLLAALAAAPQAGSPPTVTNRPSTRPISIVVLDLQNTGVDAQLAQLVSEAVVQEARKLEGLRVISASEVRTMLSMERQRQLLSSCTDTGCFAQIGGALGAQRLLTGMVGRVGDSWLLSLKVIDTANSSVKSQASERILGGRGEDFLDAVGPLFERLFPSLSLKQGEVRGVVGKRALPTRSPLLRPLAWGFGGAALAFAGGGLGFGLAARNAERDFQSLSEGSGTAPASGSEAKALADTASRRALLANVLYGVGAAAAVTSVVLFIASAGDAPPPPAPAVSVSLSPVAGGAAALIEGSF